MGDPSGRFLLRIPRELHRRLRAVALARNASLNQLCEDLLREGAWGVERAVVPAELLDAMEAVWKERLAGVVAFGSVARGEATVSSDLDLLVVLDESQPVERALYSVWQERIAPVARALVSREVSPQFVRLPSRFEDCGSLWFEAAVDGVVVRDRGARIRGLLREIRTAMARGEIRKEVAYGQPYWVRRGERQGAA